MSLQITMEFRFLIALNKRIIVANRQLFVADTIEKVQVPMQKNSKSRRNKIWEKSKMRAEKDGGGDTKGIRSPSTKNANKHYKEVE